MNLEDFINANKDKALSLNIKDDRVLQKQQIRPNIEFVQKAIDELENNLVNCLVNNNHVSNKSKAPSYLWDIRLLLEYRKLQRLEELRYYIVTHFPRWINKSPLYFDNIKAELPGFVEVLKTYLDENDVNSFNMEWVLNTTSLGIRRKVETMQDAINEMEYVIWYDKVIKTVKRASEEELLYYAVLMYLDLKDHISIETSKEIKPIELSYFLNNEEYRDKLPLIVKKIGSYTGKKMATAIGALLEMEVLVHGRRELKDLATTINPKLTTTDIKAIRNYLNPNESSKMLDDDEIERFKRWVSSL